MMIKLANLMLLCYVAACLFPAQAGKYFPVKVNMREVKWVAEAAVYELGKTLNSTYHWKLDKINHAEVQMLASGANYKMDIILGETNCFEVLGEPIMFDAHCCFLPGKDVFKKCDVLVFQFMAGTTFLVNSNCTSINRSEAVPSGVMKEGKP